MLQILKVSTVKSKQSIFSAYPKIPIGGLCNCIDLSTGKPVLRVPGIADILRHGSVRVDCPRRMNKDQYRENRQEPPEEPMTFSLNIKEGTGLAQ